MAERRSGSPPPHEHATSCRPRPPAPRRRRSRWRCPASPQWPRPRPRRLRLATSGRLPAHSARAAAEPRPCDALCAAEEPRPCDAQCAAFRSREVGTSMWKAGLPTAPSVTELNGPATTSCRHAAQALPAPSGASEAEGRGREEEPRPWSLCDVRRRRALMASMKGRAGFGWRWLGSCPCACACGSGLRGCHAACPSSARHGRRRARRNWLSRVAPDGARRGAATATVCARGGRRPLLACRPVPCSASASAGPPRSTLPRGPAMFARRCIACRSAACGCPARLLSSSRR